jgi:hypothetical protein
LPARGFVIKTAVTTELLTRIAKANGVQMIGDLLVGFKYVGRVLDGIAQDGRWGDIHATLDDFLLAAEESNGVLVSTQLRDKDASGGALLLAELCARLRQQRRTLGAYLNDVYRRYGYAANVGYSLVMEGIAGLHLVGRVMERLRACAPQSVDGRALAHTLDYWNERVFGPIRSETDRSSRNFVRLEYAHGLHVAVRPSGTEPKIKFYVEQVFDPSPGWSGEGFATARRRMDGATHRVTLSLVDHVLRLAGIELPAAALHVSPLVSLENRLDFANHFLHEMEARSRGAGAADAEQLGAWIDARLQAYGTDPRYLVRAGVAEYLRANALPAGQDRLVRALFFLS